MDYYSATEKNEIGSFIEMWMDQESVTQLSQRKNKYSILMHVCGIQKNDIDETICWAGLETKI